MTKQLSLLPLEAEGLEALIDETPIHVSKSTFKAGLSARVHRWFRLTPSFGPDLVNHMLHECAGDRSDVVLDPFAGASTTLIECKLNGLEAYGFEINPLLQFVGRVCLDWKVDIESAHAALKKVATDFSAMPNFETLEQAISYGLHVPPIHNPHRWWRDDVLIDLLKLKVAISNVQNERFRDFFRLALAGVLVPDLSNVTLGKLQLHFIDRSSHKIEVWPTFEAHAQKMLEDLVELEELDAVSTGGVFLQDTLSVDQASIPKKANIVITSPPYPNRYSYVWNTRPHLYMLDMISVAREAADLDKRTIGGTWGTATAELQKGVFEPCSPNVTSALNHILSDLRSADTLMANYVVHYFNRIEKQIVAMQRVTTMHHKVAYVVGNSEIKGTYVATDLILANIFEGLGYRVTNIARFRRRNSGNRLFETIVFAEK